MNYCMYECMKNGWMGEDSEDGDVDVMSIHVNKEHCSLTSYVEL